MIKDTQTLVFHGLHRYETGEFALVGAESFRGSILPR